MLLRLLLTEVFLHYIPHFSSFTFAVTEVERDSVICPVLLRDVNHSCVLQKEAGEHYHVTLNIVKLTSK